MVGEVDFFILDAEQLTAKCKASTDESDNTTYKHAQNYTATFFGTDFNYAT